jgi:hypothetical protein
MVLQNHDPQQPGEAGSGGEGEAMSEEEYEDLLKLALNALQSAELALEHSYDITEYPATDDCEAALALKEVKKAIAKINSP